MKVRKCILVIILATLMASCAATGTAGRSGSFTASKAHVMKAQRILAGNGYWPGRVDGIVTPKSNHALTKYQEKNGLETTGEFDEPTLRFMNIIE